MRRTALALAALAAGALLSSPATAAPEPICFPGPPNGTVKPIVCIPRPPFWP